MARTTQKQKLFNGRDHSWMQFNRVCWRRPRPVHPLLERVKFLAITGNNLDEYVEVRQAGLMQRIEDGYGDPAFDGLRPDESLAELTAEILALGGPYECWNGQLVPELRQHGIRSLDGRSWTRTPRPSRKILSARGRSAADAHLHNPTHPPRAQQGPVPGVAAPRQVASLGARFLRRARPRFARLPARMMTCSCKTSSRSTWPACTAATEVLAHASSPVSPATPTSTSKKEEARSLLETIRVELHNRRKGDAVRLKLKPAPIQRSSKGCASTSSSTPIRSSAAKAPSTCPFSRFSATTLRRPDLKFKSSPPSPCSQSRLFRPPRPAAPLRQHSPAPPLRHLPTIRSWTSYSRARRIPPSHVLKQTSGHESVAHVQGAHRGRRHQGGHAGR